MKRSCQHLQPDRLPPSRVVVLGATGFVGKKLLETLAARQFPVRGIASVEVDLTQPESVDRLRSLLLPGDALIFASALTPDRGKDLAAFIKNVKMGEHVARAVESVPLSHLIYISTDAVFPEDLPPIDEWTPPSPDNLYGQMAVSREQIMVGVAKAQKIPCLILRPCAIYGRGDTHNGYGPNRFVRLAQHEKKIKLFGYGEEMRPHLHIDDLVAVMIESLLLRTSGLLHAIPSPSLSFAEVARTVVECAVGEVTLEYVPRSGVPTHKHFIDTQLRYAFPALRRRSFSDEIRKLLEDK